MHRIVFIQSHVIHLMQTIVVTGYHWKTNITLENLFSQIDDQHETDSSEGNDNLIISVRDSLDEFDDIELVVSEHIKIPLEQHFKMSIISVTPLIYWILYWVIRTIKATT